MDDYYYGKITLPENFDSKQNGVHNFMLDLHVKKIVDCHIERFTKEINDLISQFKSEALNGLRAINKEITFIKQSMARNKEKNNKDK